MRRAAAPVFAILIFTSCLGNSPIPDPEPGPPDIAFQLPTFVRDQPASIFASLEGYPPPTVQWSFGGGLEPNTSTLLWPEVTGLVPGTYHGSVTVTNEYGTQMKNFDYEVLSSLP